jgi:hypothetical protein
VGKLSDDGSSFLLRHAICPLLMISSSSDFLFQISSYSDFLVLFANSS